MHTKHLAAAIALACLIPSLAFAQKEPLLLEHNAAIVCARYDEADNLLMTASADGIINMWDPETGLLIRSFGDPIKPSKSFYADFSRDGKVIASINGRTGKVWNTKFGDLVCSLFGYSDTIQSMHISSNSKWLITASLDGSAKLWNVQTGKRHHSLNHMFASLGKKGELAGVTDAIFCDGDLWTITGSDRPIPTSKAEVDSLKAIGKEYIPKYDSNAHIWDLKTGKLVHTLIGYPFEVSPDGTQIVTGSANTTETDAHVWEVLSGKMIRPLKGSAGRVTSVQFSNNKKMILTGTEDGRVKLFDAVLGKSICYLDFPVNGKSHVEFSPDSKWIVTFASDTARLYSVSSGQQFRSLPASRPLVFSNDSKHMVVIEEKNANVYEVASGKPVMVEKKKSSKALKVR